ncbi:GNAT family N-acetyltransferase [Seohaeicola zhoushanensis]|uniref:Alanine acetyltransferase n=1 Tax=Seohaeicola zhoushanensis TaxID=1569283 RepID=A0A8J3H1M3_9RHOB|nr:GNAT family N-acetyltransferase [Seohaeicola zhoushanensis]GHF64048.1 alanine acetyltransferase [Seohaeicola zhoushanensis]
MTPEEMARLHRAAYDDRPWSATEFAGLMGAKGVFVTGDARAFALVRVLFDEAELLTIATHPEHRRQGLARRLMEDWQAQAAAMGATRALLEVAADNGAAQALYLSCGYREDGRRKGYYERRGAPPADALLMSRPLTHGQAGA